MQSIGELLYLASHPNYGQQSLAQFWRWLEMHKKLCWRIPMRGSLAFLAGTVLLAIYAPPSAPAQEFPTESELRQSEWDTVYTAGSQSVSARVKFNGDTGTYTTSSNSTGQLSNIEYGVDVATNPGAPFFQITGDYSKNGKSGSFLFSSQGATKFTGSWSGDTGGGTWKGTLVSQVTGVKFGGWNWDGGNSRYWCEYTYPSKNDPNVRLKQKCLWYPNDPQRTNNYYFLKSNGQAWGKCVCPKDPNYNPNQMQWSLMGSNNQWQPQPAGDCPPPGNGDPMDAAIGSIPDPPA